MLLLKSYFKKQHNSITFLVSALSLLILFGCAGQKFKLKQIDSTPEIMTEDLSIQIDDSLSLSGFDLTVNGYLKEFDYESKIDKLLFSYGPQKDKSDLKTFVMYDLNSREIDWIQEGNPYVHIMNEDIIQFIKGATINLYDTEDGNFLRKSEGGLYLSGDGVAYVLARKKFSRIDIYTGEKLWERKGYDWEGHREEFTYEDWMYIVADGLHAFKIESGEGWDMEVSNWYKDHLKEMAKQCGLAFLGALSGGVNTSQYRPDIYHNLNSNILVIGDNIYFAARKNVYCIDRFSGMIVWQQELPEELGSMWIDKISDDKIALTGQGWKYLNFVMTKALPPSFTILDITSGEIHAQFKSEEYDFVLDSDFTQDDKYFLTSKCLYTFDSEYNLTVQLDKTEKYGYMLRLVDTESALVLRTENGVVSLNKNSLEENWFSDLGGLHFENKNILKDKWTYPYILSSFENRRSWSSDILDWFPSLEGVTALDIYNNGQTVKEIPISGDDYIITSNGELISMFENNLSFITLK